MPRPFSEEQRRRAIWMKEMLGYQVNGLPAALKMTLSFDPTTLIEIAVSSYGYNWEVWRLKNASLVLSKLPACIHNLIYARLA